MSETKELNTFSISSIHSNIVVFSPEPQFPWGNAMMLMHVVRVFQKNPEKKKDWLLYELLKNLPILGHREKIIFITCARLENHPQDSSHF